jgi:hypothetical protein
MRGLLEFMSSNAASNLFSRVMPYEEENALAVKLARQYEAGKLLRSPTQKEDFMTRWDGRLGGVVEVNGGLAAFLGRASHMGFQRGAVVDSSDQSTVPVPCVN